MRTTTTRLVPLDPSASGDGAPTNPWLAKQGSVHDALSNLSPPERALVEPKARTNSHLGTHGFAHNETSAGRAKDVPGRLSSSSGHIDEPRTTSKPRSLEHARRRVRWASAAAGAARRLPMPLGPPQAEPRARRGFPEEASGRVGSRLRRSLPRGVVGCAPPGIPEGATSHASCAAAGMSFGGGTCVGRRGCCLDERRRRRLRGYTAVGATG